jgi:hypothetical protein
MQLMKIKRGKIHLKITQLNTAIRCKTVNNLPMHVPFTRLYPDLHVHVYEPTVFWHSLFISPHTLGVRHSLTSVSHRLPIQPVLHKHPLTGSQPRELAPHWHVLAQLTPYVGYMHATKFQKNKIKISNLLVKQKQGRDSHVSLVISSYIKEYKF